MKFDDTEIEEHKFHQNKNTILIKDVDMDKTVVSNNLPFGKEDFKYFIGYKDNKTIRPWCLFLPEIWFERYCDRTTYIYFVIKDELTFDKYMRIFVGVSNITEQNLVVKLYIMKII